MAQNVYDQASRYLAKRDPSGMLCWLLKVSPQEMVFRRWLDTRLIPFPGEPDRFCDTVAFLEDIQSGHVPWAALLEFQLEPDALMFGRALSYIGQLWLEIKPADERGDRFEIGVMVVNLTGKGRTTRTSSWPAAGMLTSLKPVEVNLCEIEAQATLNAIAAGETSAILLPLIPLMHEGNQSGMIQQWVALASAEPDAGRRGDYGGLVLVFAEAAGCHAAWKSALQGWNMVQSQQVLEWMAEGETRAKRADILRVLELRFGELPADLVAAIRATEDLTMLVIWLDTAVTAQTLADFRQTIGI